MTNETKKLEILVVEDSSLHQQSARDLLTDHNLTIVESMSQAQETLFDRRQISAGDNGEMINSPRYDVVLTDMLLPNYKGGEQLHGFGYPIAMLAINAGIPYVAIVTDSVRHAHPITDTVSQFTNRVEFEGYKINEAPIVQQLGNSRLAILKSGSSRDGNLIGKDWKSALNLVMTQEPCPSRIAKEYTIRRSKGKPV